METICEIIYTVQKLSSIGSQSDGDAPTVCSAIDMLCEYAGMIIDNIEREKHG